MKRRDFIALLGGAAAWPLAARGQQARRVGVLMGGPATDSVLQAYVAGRLHGFSIHASSETKTVMMKAARITAAAMAPSRPSHRSDSAYSFIE
jgi:putative ABC transport system substrate-binding protein